MSTFNQNDLEAEPDTRVAFIASLREVADWLEATPAAPTPYISPYDGYAFTLPLGTNARVHEAAQALGLEVATDSDGNTACKTIVGVIRWQMYGYADFDEFSEQMKENNARQWAKRKGLEIVKPIVSDDTIRQAENFLELNVADREAREAAGGAA